jgi:TPR repeat protein
MGVNIAGARAETTEQRKQFDQAYADFKLGNYATALSEFEILAEAGNVAAQYNLGFMRAKGLGGPVDLVAAYVWFTLVAKAGQERGQRSLNELISAMSVKQISEGERLLQERQKRLQGL